jgi:hypothetical protein
MGCLLGEAWQRKCLVERVPVPDNVAPEEHPEVDRHSMLVVPLDSELEQMLEALDALRPEEAHCHTPVVQKLVVFLQHSTSRAVESVQMRVAFLSSAEVLGSKKVAAWDVALVSWVVD